MSRIGKKFINIPEKVKVELNGQKISVDGPKGNLSRILPSLVCCTMEDNKLIIEKTQDTSQNLARKMTAPEVAMVPHADTLFEIVTFRNIIQCRFKFYVRCYFA